MLGGVESLYVCVCVHIKVLSKSLYIQQVLLYNPSRCYNYSRGASDGLEAGLPINRKLGWRCIILQDATIIVG